MVEGAERGSRDDHEGGVEGGGEARHVVVGCDRDEQATGAFDDRYVAPLRQGAALDEGGGDIDGRARALGGDGGRERLREGDEGADGDSLVAEDGAVKGFVAI